MVRVTTSRKHMHAKSRQASTPRYRRELLTATTVSFYQSAICRYSHHLQNLTFFNGTSSSLLFYLPIMFIARSEYGKLYLHETKPQLTIRQIVGSSKLHNPAILALTSHPAHSPPKAVYFRLNTPSKPSSSAPPPSAYAPASLTSHLRSDIPRSPPTKA